MHAPPARRPALVEKHALVGRLIDCQILAGFAADAMAMATCPENTAAVSLARDALTKLQAILRSEAGRLDRLA
jgi:hypothetical protein